MATQKKGGSFIKQAAILAVAGILVRLLGFLYRIPMTNMIGDQGNAIYSAGYYIYTFLLILSSAGLPAAISKMVSERIALKEYRNSHNVFRVALMVSGTLGFICMVLMFTFAKSIAQISNSPESYYCILTLSPTLFIVAIMSAYRGYFQGMNTMVPTAISQIVEQIFNAFFSVYLAWVFLGVNIDTEAAKAAGGKNIILGAAGGTAGTGIGAFAGLLIIFFSYWLIRPQLKKRAERDRGREKWESKGKIANELMRTALPIIIGTAVFSITNLIDMNMVTRILEGSGVAHEQAQNLYGQLSGKYVTLTTVPVSISTAIATAAIPSIAASMKLHERKNVKRKMNMTLRISMLISVPAAVGISVLGNHIIEMLFPKYSEGGILLVVGGVSIIFLALCQTVTGILQGIGQVKIPVIGAVLGAVTKVILNYKLIAIPEINVVGAVLSTTGCYAVASIFNLIMLYIITRVPIDLVGSVVKPVLGSVLMGAACIGVYKLIFMMLPYNTVCTILSILVGIGIYGFVMLLIKGVKEDDLQSLPMGRKMITICHKVHLL